MNMSNNEGTIIGQNESKTSLMYTANFDFKVSVHFFIFIMD